MGDAWKRWAIIYVDDIVVVGSTEEECSERTKTLLDALDTMDKKISKKSTTLPAETVDCIGFNFSRNSYGMTEEGVSKLRNALVKPVKTTSDLKGLIGSIQYAKSAFADPVGMASELSKLTALLKQKKYRDNQIVPDVQKTLSLLVAPKRLSYPGQLSKGTIIIMTDASDTGIGGSLFKTDSTDMEHIDLENAELIDVISHVLSECEQRWHTFEKEIYAVYTALCKWKAFLISNHHITILVLSDSRTTVGKLQQVSLIDNNTAKTRRFCGWSEELAYISSLKIQFRFVNGTENCLADLLSRSAMKSQAIVWSVQTREDETHRRITEILKDAQTRSPAEKIAIPTELLGDLLRHLHQQYHYGRRETLAQFNALFTSEKAYEMVKIICDSCPCAIAKGTRRSTFARAPLSTDGVPFSKIAIDTVGPIKPRSRNCDYILSILCTTTKFIVLCPIESIDSQTLSRSLLKSFWTYGFPDTIVLDNHPCFRSASFLNFAKENFIELRHTPIFSPQRNGLLERQHRIINDILRYHFQEKRKEWSDQLPNIQKERQTIQEQRNQNCNRKNKNKNEKR